MKAEPKARLPISPAKDRRSPLTYFGIAHSSYRAVRCPTGKVFTNLCSNAHHVDSNMDHSRGVSSNDRGVGLVCLVARGISMGLAT
jgi:hypothetical protein